jgi:hypothetical protein
MLLVEPGLYSRSTAMYIKNKSNKCTLKTKETTTSVNIL